MRRFALDLFSEAETEARYERHDAKRTVGAALEEAKADGRIRDDVPSLTLWTYLGVVLDGLVLRAALGYPLPDREQLLSLVRQGIAPPP